MQLVHPKLSGNGLLSSWAVQNRSQNCRSIPQSEVILQYIRDPGSPAVSRPKGVKPERKRRGIARFYGIWFVHWCVLKHSGFADYSSIAQQSCTHNVRTQRINQIYGRHRSSLAILLDRVYDIKVYSLILCMLPGSYYYYPVTST